MYKVSTSNYKLSKSISSSIFYSYSDSKPSIDSNQNDDISILDAEILDDSLIKIKKIFQQSKSSTLNSSNTSDNDLITKVSWERTEVNTKNDNLGIEGAKLSSLFVYRDYWSVKKYLKGNIQLRELLFETFHKFLQYFGNDTQFVLELVPDIYEPNFEQLFIRVISKQSIIKNLDILDSFENNWWFDRTAYITNSPVITLE